MHIQGRTIIGNFISRIELFLLVVLLVFGSIMIVMTPLGAGYDEDQHFFRVWQLASREMLPQEMSASRANFPEIYYDLSYRRQPLVGSVGFDYWQKYLGVKLYERGYHYGPFDTRSRYTPPLLLPQAAALYIARWGGLSALGIYYATRLAGLLSYTFLAWLAVRYIPIGKWTMVVLAVAPMSIYQASTINADSITNGIGLLFIGGTLYIAHQHVIQGKNVGVLILLFALLFLTKPNIFPLALLPFLIISPSRFSNKFFYFWLIASAFGLFAIEFIGWNILSPNRGFIPSGDVNAVEQVKYIFTHPLAFVGVILTDLWGGSSTYLRQWIGVYGFDYGTVPILTYVFFALGLISSLIIRTDSQTPDRRARIGLITVFVASFLFTLLSLYVTFTAVGEKFVYGVQGRYLIPIFPLLFLALYNLPVLQRFRSSLWVTWVFSLGALAAFVVGLILNYHVVCGASYYTTGVCLQPFYKNYSPLLRSTPPIADGDTFVQEILPKCDGLTLIQVRINSVGQDEHGATEFIVQDENQTITRTAETIQNNAFTEDAWHVINFAPDWNSNNKLYTLTIRSIGGQPEDGPQFAYSLRPEYLDGALYQNGSPVEDDIIFQYGCITGLEKALQFANSK